MNKEEYIAKAIEIVERNNIERMINEGKSEEVAKAHFTIGKANTVSILSNTYDIFVEIGAIATE